MTGVRLALTWLTVLPVRGPATVTRADAARAIALCPLIGILLGAGGAGLLWLLLRGDLAAPLAGLLVVAALALATRGMHIDGLSDTMDGLGCYGPPQRAQEVMRSGGAGPFGVFAIVVAAGAQAFAIGALGVEGHWIAVVVAVTAGRVAAVIACRRGVPAFSERGFGALVADTQSVWGVAAWSCALVVAAGWAAPSWWQGPVVVVAALAVAFVLVRHCARRFGGINGDVLGAAVEVTVAACAVGLTLG
ncbi:MAG: adenosylcobinamide-GDP ribazoletransferase [Aldersonia sp.]|nr:adenosylcobinamide-GDP ribazoletransferase [Aldersonia sp.]